MERPRTHQQYSHHSSGIDKKKTPMDGILMKQNRRMTLITLAWQIEPARTDEWTIQQQNCTETYMHVNWSGMYVWQLLSAHCSERMMDNVNGRISSQFLWEKVRYSGVACDFKVIFGEFFLNRLFNGHRPRVKCRCILVVHTQVIPMYYAPQILMVRYASVIYCRWDHIVWPKITSNNSPLNVWYLIFLVIYDTQWEKFNSI